MSDVIPGGAVAWLQREPDFPDDLSLSGMGREVENLILENTQLLETK